MKFFLDTADVDQLKKAVEMGVCDGATTNPSLVARTGKPFDQVIREVLDIVPGPVSLEVIALDTEGMLSEARSLHARNPEKVVVKIPMTPAGIRAVKILSEEGVKTNVTLIFSASQALIAAKAGATYVSPFVGRLDDISQQGMDLVSDIMTIFENYGFDTEVIVASVRHPMHVVEAALMGADVATIPFAIIEKLFKHPLTDSGIEKFLKDFSNVPKD